MKIVLGSYRFAPDVGGIESVSASLASEFVRLGHEVRLLTESAGGDGQRWPFEVVRRPSLGRLIGLVRWGEVFFQNNISLGSAWAAFFCRKPWVVAHQTWIAGVDGTVRWRDRLKRFLLRFASNISISRAIAEQIGVASTIVGNPYRSDVFKLLATGARSRDLVFLGRLVSDKGLDVLVEALALLRRDGLKPRLTVIGTGPEEEPIRQLAASRGVSEQVEFAGLKTGDELAELLNQHEIMVVPSRWAEPFGVVALEGIACGCVVIGSEDGGLKEAIGECGLVFPNGNAEALTAVLRRALADSALRESCRAHRAAHLARFEAERVAQDYLRIFEEAAR